MATLPGLDEPEFVDFSEPRPELPALAREISFEAFQQLRAEQRRFFASAKPEGKVVATTPPDNQGWLLLSQRFTGKESGN